MKSVWNTRAWTLSREAMEMLCAFLKSRVSQSESSSSDCCPSPCMLKTALKSTFNSLITGCIYCIKLTSNKVFFFSPTGKYLASHPSNNLECTLFSKHANCIAFWCDSLPCVCHTDVTPLPPWMHQSWNLKAVRNKSSCYAFNANKHKLHGICNAQAFRMPSAALCKLFHMHA